MLPDPALGTANHSCGLQDHAQLTLQAGLCPSDKEDWHLDRFPGASVAAGDQMLGSVDALSAGQ